jgi:hypothetical protein
MTVDWFKARLLLGLLAANPVEFIDRVGAILEVNLDRLRGAPDYPVIPWQHVVGEVTRTLGIDAASLDREIDDHRLESSMAAGIASLGADPQFALRHNADFRLARLCYIACRAVRPQAVVETGVAYGVTSSFVLKALDANNRGHLYSIDLPPLAAAAETSVGRLVPEQLRSRWTLLRGTSRRVLPSLLGQLGKVDVFIHDSLHTFRNMSAEFAGAHAHRADPFVLIADDIEANGAFAEYVERCGSALSLCATCAAAAKNTRCGICISRSVRINA